MVRTMTGIDSKAIAAAIFDPSATEGLKGERTLTEWQTDAVMRVLSALTASASEPAKDRLPTRDEARQAAKMLLACNGADLDAWGAGYLIDDIAQDALKELTK